MAIIKNKNIGKRRDQLTELKRKRVDQRSWNITHYLYLFADDAACVWLLFEHDFCHVIDSNDHAD